MERVTLSFTNQKSANSWGGSGSVQGLLARGRSCLFPYCALEVSNSLQRLKWETLAVDAWIEAGLTASLNFLASGIAEDAEDWIFETAASSRASRLASWRVGGR